jgi:TonB family protein
MILTMAYILVIAALLGFAAHVGERLGAELGWARRGPWLVALVASLALPAFAIFSVASPSAATSVLSLPPIFDQPTPSVGVPASATAQPSGPSFNWPDWQAFDTGFAALWIASSAALLLLGVTAIWRVHRITQDARTLAIGDREVLVSDRLGPAVFGFLRPRIVLPRWLAEEASTLRARVLDHEVEHIAARDQISLLAALLIVAAMPWNLALWWQLRRLRTAIEVDCDSRVLRRGVNARDYSEALLAVGQHARRTPFAAVALTEPVSELERRIRIMLDKAHTFSPTGFGARCLVVTAVLSVAVAVNAPQAQQAGEASDASAAPKAIPSPRPAIAEKFSAAIACMGAGDDLCMRRELDEIAALPDLNTYETGQLQSYLALYHWDNDDWLSAMTAYETIRRLPQDQLPDSLIQSATRNLVGLYVQEGRLQKGLDMHDSHLALPSVTPTASDHHLRATLLYRLGQYPAALAATEEAIAATEGLHESYYELLLALQAITGDEAGAAETHELLIRHWPERERPGDLDIAALAEDALGGAAARRTPTQSLYLPIVKGAPDYPPRALDRGHEGFVVVQFTVTRNGSTRDLQIVESTNALFDRAAIEAVAKFKYRPRVIDGSPVEVPGVTTRIVFELPDDA